MKHTLESLLALASTDEGKQQIRVMVAERLGLQTRYFRFSYPGHASLNGGCNNWVRHIASKKEADIARVSHLQWQPEKVTPVEEYEDLCEIRPYHTSLDAIMPEVRKLNEGEKARFLNELQSVCAVVVSRHFTLARAMLSADPIHHCIALLLSLQA